ncbi:hypothetical protein STEG23_018315, partial [Scotinomys teguina]
MTYCNDYFAVFCILDMEDCRLKNREPDVLAPWFLDPGGWSKTTAVRLYFIFPGICTLSLVQAQVFCK